MSNIFKAPQAVPDDLLRDVTIPMIFLAGTIDMGNSHDWQKDIIDLLVDRFGDEIIILSPRRDDWDSSWEQRIDNPKFAEQVNWELEMIELSDHVYMHFEKDSKSPITLLELGLIAAEAPEKLMVHCPDGFYRKGNVDIVCKRYGVKQLKNHEDVVAHLSGNYYEPHKSMGRIYEHRSS